jgi:GNAT superfamily N-acetyltransferase
VPLAEEATTAPAPSYQRPRQCRGRWLCGDSRPETCGLGTGPNQPARGSHVATASFLVDPARQGRGVGRAFGEYVLDWCRQTGFASIQFNAVVASNAPAVHLWQSLGFRIIGTAPASFDHPEHGLVGLHIMFRHL